MLPFLQELTLLSLAADVFIGDTWEDLAWTYLTNVKLDKLPIIHSLLLLSHPHLGRTVQIIIILYVTYSNFTMTLKKLFRFSYLNYSSLKICFICTRIAVLTNRKNEKIFESMMKLELNQIGKGACQVISLLDGAYAKCPPK